MNRVITIIISICLMCSITTSFTANVSSISQLQSEAISRSTSPLVPNTSTPLLINPTTSYAPVARTSSPSVSTTPAATQTPPQSNTESSTSGSQTTPQFSWAKIHPVPATNKLGVFTSKGYYRNVSGESYWTNCDLRIDVYEVKASGVYMESSNMQQNGLKWSQAVFINNVFNREVYIIGQLVRVGRIFGSTGFFYKKSQVPLVFIFGVPVPVLKSTCKFVESGCIPRIPMWGDNRAGKHSIFSDEQSGGTCMSIMNVDTRNNPYPHGKNPRRMRFGGSFYSGLKKGLKLPKAIKGGRSKRSNTFTEIHIMYLEWHGPWLGNGAALNDGRTCSAINRYYPGWGNAPITRANEPVYNLMLDRRLFCTAFFLKLDLTTLAHLFNTSTYRLKTMTWTPLDHRTNAMFLNFTQELGETVQSGLIDDNDETKLIAFLRRLRYGQNVGLNKKVMDSTSKKFILETIKELQAMIRNVSLTQDTICKYLHHVCEVANKTNPVNIHKIIRTQAEHAVDAEVKRQFHNRGFHRFVASELKKEGLDILLHSALKDLLANLRNNVTALIGADKDLKREELQDKNDTSTLNKTIREHIGIKKPDLYAGLFKVTSTRGPETVLEIVTLVLDGVFAIMLLYCLFAFIFKRCLKREDY